MGGTCLQDGGALASGLLCSPPFSNGLHMLICRRSLLPFALPSDGDGFPQSPPTSLTTCTKYDKMRTNHLEWYSEVKTKDFPSPFASL